MSKYMEQITKIIFWAAFVSFLLMSIPHVAWLFRFYEPKGDRFDGLWWGLSLGVALSIDVLICWLSYMRTEENQATRFDGFATWLFIILLALLSWFCNWLFAEVQIGTDVWSITLGYGWTIGNLTPFIVSAMPIFILAYTYMSRRILSKKAEPKSAAMLKKEADELQEKVVQIGRISSLKTQRQKHWFQEKITAGKEIISSLKDEEKLPTSGKESTQNVPPISAETGEELEQIIGENEAIVDEDLPLNLPRMLPTSARESVPQLGMIEQQMYDTLLQHPEELKELSRLFYEQDLDQFVATLQAKYSQHAGYITPGRVTHVMQRLAYDSKHESHNEEEEEIKGKYFVTFAEASKMTGYAEVTLRAQAKRGEIEERKGKLKVTSLKKKPGYTSTQMPAIKEGKIPITNGHQH